MSRTATDPTRSVEAKQALAEGDKCLKTSAFKWKPDYLSAEPCYQKAGRAFKAAGMMDSAVDAWKKAAFCSSKMGNIKQASITLEGIAKELAMVPTGKEAASKLLEESSDLLIEAGEYVRAAELKMRAGKLLEGANNERAAKLYDDACAVFDGHETQDVYASETLKKALTLQIGVGKHASAMRTMDKLYDVFTRLNQPHNVNKLLLSRVVLLLAAGDPISAQRDYEKHLDFPGYASSGEAAAAEDAINCYAEGNPDALKSVVARNVFNYLDHNVARLAKGLPTALTRGGDAIGAATPEESAVHGVSHAPEVAPAGGVGASTSSLSSFSGPGGLRPVNIGSSAGPAGGADTSAAQRKRQTAAEVERSALFARPAAPGSGGGGAGSEPAHADESGWVSAKPRAAAAAAAPAGVAASTAKPKAAPAPAPVEEPAAEDYDYEKAFADLGIDENADLDEHHEHAPAAVAAPAPAPTVPARNPFDDVEEEPAPAAAAAPAEELDLGIL